MNRGRRLAIGNQRIISPKGQATDVSRGTQIREAGIPHPRKKIKTYLGIMGYLWALEWRRK